MTDDEAQTPRLTMIGAVEPVARCPILRPWSCSVPPASLNRACRWKEVRPPSGPHLGSRNQARWLPTDGAPRWCAQSAASRATAYDWVDRFPRWSGWRSSPVHV